MQEKESMEAFDKAGYFDKIGEGSRTKTYKSVAEIREEQEKLMKKRFSEVQRECSKYGFKTWTEGKKTFIATSNGKWYFNGEESSIHLFHKNYKFRQSTMGNYHRQFVKNIDIPELISYISNHDKEANERR